MKILLSLQKGELEKIGVIDKNDVVDSHRERVKKAYPAYFDTYNRIDELISYLNGFENLYCVGKKRSAQIQQYGPFYGYCI